uniref:ISL LIM homeobox 2 n=1 Tax=Pygocentrus nattereri TaxID=42514 RepID=A0A3B4BUP8_PYGNA
ILRVSPDLEWHAACLKCSECEQHLDESCTCFIKDGKTLCKKDYSRLYASKCPKCLRAFSSHDYVIRTHGGIYHVQCFRCMGCDRQLVPGDRFTLRDGNPQCAAHPQHCRGLLCPLTPAQHTLTHHHHRSDRVTRVRTVLSKAQLHTLRSCYSVNPRPDAMLKEQLVEMTGLSPRVIRVWFQNKRCKDKKKSTAARQIQHQPLHNEHKNIHKYDYIIVFPDSLDRDILMTPLDFQSLEPSWKLLTNFSLHSDSDHDHVPDQYLVKTMTSCSSAGSEIVPISIDLPNTPRSITSSPAEAKK